MARSFRRSTKASSASALLILLGFLYERYGTYEISAFGGLAARLRALATLFVITSLALAGLPLLSGFVGEFLTLSGTYAGHKGWVAAAAVGVILSATYMLRLVQKVFYADESDMVRQERRPDLGFREQVTLWPMAVLMLVMGVASPFWMRAMDEAAVRLVHAAAPLPPTTPLPGVAEKQ